MAIEFRILGDVEANREGQALVLGPSRPRAVLVALLLDVNKPVQLGELVSRVWGEKAPRQAHSSLHSYFTRLRSALGNDAGIVRRGRGYAIEVDDGSIDLNRFRRSVTLARNSTCPSEALAHFDAALELWRGEPFAGLDSPWLNNARTALLAEHESVVLDRTDKQLELGLHTSLLAELSSRADRQPLNERVAAQMMLTLYRSDRQAEALLYFDKIRSALAEELGVDPGPTLRALHQQILLEDPRLRPAGSGKSLGPVAAEASGESPSDDWLAIVPRQLPSAPRSFVGRRQELEKLSDALTPDGSTTRVAVVTGAGGMGKSWLTQQWAHHHLDLFPDGQLFANLRGFEPSLDPVSPHQAMRTFLMALEIDPNVIPDEPQAMTGLYRSVLADKRVLLVVDDARTADQVAALVPSGPGCSLIVTSRNRLTSLVTSHNATLLSLDPLDDQESLDLLASGLGAERSKAEAVATGQLAAACGGLPLALAITIGRVQENPEFPLESLVAELHDAGSALNALDVDEDLSIRAVLSTSYAALPSEQAEVFRLLGIAPGSDIDVTAAGALIGKSYAATRVLLRALERASLLHQHSPGRFRMHDLVRLYAREQAEEHISEDVLRAAVWRFSNFYLHTAVPAQELLVPGRPRITIDPPPEGCNPLTMHSSDEAWRWFEIEEPNLRTIQSHAEGLGWRELVWQISWAITNIYSLRGLHREVIAIWQAALRAAEARNRPSELTVAHRFLAIGSARSGLDDAALDHIEKAVALAERTDDIVDRILALKVKSELNCRAGRMELAVADGTLGWELARDQPAHIRERLASDLAWCLTENGQYEEASTMAQVALDLGKDLEEKLRATNLDTLGQISLRTGNPDQAIDYFNQALALLQKPQDFSERANTLYALGTTYSQLGHVGKAKTCLSESLEMFRQQHSTELVRLAESALESLTGNDG
ncbi:AfsR/SARP family transcriptional regulator [Amycolatopsis sp. NPDC004368]